MLMNDFYVKIADPSSGVCRVNWFASIEDANEFMNNYEYQGEEQITLL